MRFLHTLSYLFLVCSIVYAQDNLTIAPEYFQIDEGRLLIVCGMYEPETSPYEGADSLVFAVGERTFTLSDLSSAPFTYTNSYAVSDALGKEYTLYFTRLPLLSINTSETIVDEPKIAVDFTYADKEQVLVTKAGAELRGYYSLTLPKKTYDLELWEDETGAETRKVKFGSLREDDDWILDGLYNEPLRIRSHVTAKLWLDMHHAYYQDEEPNAKMGVDIMDVELFLNGSYQGLYHLSEQLDRKQLQLKDFEGEMRGELFKAGYWDDVSTFDALYDYDNNERVWGGYEFKYPKASETTDWGPLYDWKDFILNSSDSVFTAEVWQRVEPTNFLDYYIFLQYILATDNIRKNFYIARYDQDEPYLLLPWDFDGCFGNNWDGTNLPDTATILSNNLMDRILANDPGQFRETVEMLYVDYRQNLLHPDSLIDKIERRFAYLTEEKIYERESLVFGNYDFQASDLSYLTDWIRSRTAFLDAHFNYTAPLPTSTRNFAISSPLRIYPNPTTDIICVDLPVSKETFSNYLVYDASGVIVDTGFLSAGQLNVRSLNPGIYILRIGGRSARFAVQ